MRSFDLTGKVALVSGATGHLGSALSTALADAGADLVVSSRTRSSLEALAERLRESSGRRVGVVAADLTDASDATRLGNEAWEVFGQVDVVVCNAAPVLADIQTGQSLDTSDEDWYRMHELMVWGPLRALRQLIPRMAERGTGSIITMCSSSGNSPVPGIDAYGMAKGALQLLTKYLAKECGASGVRANGLMPAGIVTDPAEEGRVRRIMEENGLLARISLGRIGRTDDLIGPALFLASEHSGYMTGQVLNVDGGRV